MSLKYVPEGPIDNKSVLVLAVAWHQIGNKLLPEPMMAKIYDALCVVHESLLYSRVPL